MAAAVVRGIHALYVAFVITAPLALLLGAVADVRVLRGRLLRRLHLACLAFVAAQHALGWACPLTELENALAGRPPGTTFLPAAEAPLPAWAVAATVALYLALGAVGHAAAWRRAREGAA